MQYMALYCAVLCCAVLCCAVLCCQPAAHSVCLRLTDVITMLLLAGDAAAAEAATFTPCPAHFCSRGNYMMQQGLSLCATASKQLPQHLSLVHSLTKSYITLL